MYPTEGDWASSIRVGDRFVGDRMGNGFGMEDPYGFLGRDRGDEGGGGGSREPIANDILDLLPSDPFGMDLSATFTAIADWLEDFEVESGLNLIWNRAMVFGSSDNGIGESLNTGWRLNGSGSFEEEMEIGDESCDGEFDSAWDVEEILSFGDEDAIWVFSNRPEEAGESAESCSGGDGGAPHDALLLSLGYLEVQDLLSAERVCRSFRDAVQGRAQGCLQSLSLAECSRITDDGLRRVLESNPRLTKLSVPGCTRLSIGGLVNNLKTFNSTGMPGIKCLRIGGLYGITQQHFEELISLLNADKQQQTDARKPRFFHSSHLLHSNDDECPIDIEMCPKCQRLRLVYDCPVQSCQGKQNSAQQCRACSFCIASVVATKHSITKSCAYGSAGSCNLGLVSALDLDVRRPLIAL
ncbi:hypothetical protein MRB53_016205 [Persea americana]|uniref:Uncharacterized protein n=1 Tax=Persea americana TaxID=3435 RepID=A0ACC2M1N2_PERAE|nr:hypothetical protein MRB53_016205 [Persea americana]